jgi:flagellar motor switch protein FliM
MGDSQSEEEKAAAEWEAMMAADGQASGEGGAASGDGEGGDAAAEWEAMLAGSEGGEESGAGAGDSGAGAGDDKVDQALASRVLSQDEIDSLLGFSSKDDTDRSSGIFAILDKSLGTYEKLPMLEVVFDRLVRMMSTSMRNFTSDNVDISIDSITSLRFGDYLNSIPLPALIVIFKAIEWDNYGVITCNSSLIYSIVDVMLGGRRATRQVRIEGRPYTTIEQDLVKSLMEVALADMSAAFDPISPVTFTYDRLETNPRFATISRPNNAAVLVRLRVDMDERGGNMEILFPHATLEPIRDLLLQMFMGEKFGRDSLWENHLSKELKNTEVNLEALIHEKLMKLGEVANFKVGTTILLDQAPDDNIQVCCGSIPLFSAKIGRFGDNMAVRIVDRADRKIEEDA